MAIHDILDPLNFISNLSVKTIPLTYGYTHSVPPKGTNFGLYMILYVVWWGIFCPICTFYSCVRI